MRIYLGLLMAALAMPGAALAQGGPDSAYHACVERLVGELDDSTSDARTVAGGVMAACRPFFIAALAASVPGVRESLLNQAIRERRESDLDNIVWLVLKARRGKTKP